MFLGLWRYMLGYQKIIMNFAWKTKFSNIVGGSQKWKYIIWITLEFFKFKNLVYYAALIPQALDLHIRSYLLRKKNQTAEKNRH